MIFGSTGEPWQVRKGGTQHQAKSAWKLSTLRFAAYATCTTLILFALIFRLIQVQLIDGEKYRMRAQENQIRLIPVAAPRGIILDRDGHVLARSRPSFVVGLIPSEVESANGNDGTGEGGTEGSALDAELTVLARTIAVPKATLMHRLLHHRGINYTNFDQVVTYEPYGPIILASDLQVSTVARLSELLTDLPGVDLEVQPVRNYPLGTAGAHIFGYVGQISESEYEQLKGKGYSPNDVIGKDGLEDFYDSYLRGVPGGQRIVVDATGAVVPNTKLPEKAPEPGDTLVLNVDRRLQMIADNVLTQQLNTRSRDLGRRLSGAVVIEDPYTGGILALASYPEFDPNDFIAENDKKIIGYLTDPAHPLYDDAIAAATPTGSTFKMVTGSGAITEGVVRPDEIVYDSGAWNCGGYLARDIASGGLGDTTFIPALAASSDGYFYQMGWRLGNARLRKWALLFGLNSPSGIDLPGEIAGNWPTNASMMRDNGVPLEPADACFLAIGQGAMQATPLQMVNVASAVINGGTLYRPHLVSEIRDPQGRTLKRFDGEIIRQVPATQEALAAVRGGMARVTDPGGTAYGLAIPGLPFSGKTGTAETAGGAGPNTTWFIAWAPTDRPTLAMAVFVDRSGGYGADVAAPIAREILVQYFRKKE